MRRVVPWVAVTGLVLTGHGCGGSDDAGALPDGRHFGYIRTVDTGVDPARIEFDAAEWLSGEQAQQAAEADGAVDPGEPVANDYYVRNAATDTEELDVAAGVQVTRVDCSDGCREAPGEFGGLAASFGRRGASLTDDYRGAESQYWVTLADGVVVAIDEQYVP